jgi:D-alanyl-D-alanine carboxypeptidase/D-alanyl-D-alanine-endopeptidase (penicillin-binding protein 4)
MHKKKIVALLCAIYLAGCGSSENTVPSPALKISTITEQKTVIPDTTIAASPPPAVMTAYDSLFGKIKQKFNDTLFSNAHWGVKIQSMKTGKVWFECNQDKLFNPASNEKIPTTSSALITLGPDFKFETNLCYSGRIKGKTLDGNLIVFGNGDPTVNYFFGKSSLYLFRQWAKQLADSGITKIKGNIIGDDNSFDDNTIGHGWGLDELGDYYAAEISPLQLNEGYLDLTITPPEAHQSARNSVKIESNIKTKYIDIINKVSVNDKGINDITIERPYGTNKFIVHGSVAKGGKPISEAATVFNQTKFYVTVFKEILEEEGITVTGKAIDCDDIEGWSHRPSDFSLIDNHYSPPLKEIIPVLMKRSQNLYAETMTRILGVNNNGKGSFDSGKKTVSKVLKEFGIRPGSYAYTDGSGLSRYDYIAPSQIVKILTGMRRSQYWQDWYNAFPVAGVDGTLQGRMKGTKAEGNVRAKTGTLSNVRGLSGYVTTASGEEIAFSFLLNGHLRQAKDVDKITDAVLKMIAEFK